MDSDQLEIPFKQIYSPLSLEEFARTRKLYLTALKTCSKKVLNLELSVLSKTFRLYLKHLIDEENKLLAVCTTLFIVGKHEFCFSFERDVLDRLVGKNLFAVYLLQNEHRLLKIIYKDLQSTTTHDLVACFLRRKRFPVFFSDPCFVLDAYLSMFVNDRLADFTPVRLAVSVVVFVAQVCFPAMFDTTLDLFSATVPKPVLLDALRRVAGLVETQDCLRFVFLKTIKKYYFDSNFLHCLFGDF